MSFFFFIVRSDMGALRRVSVGLVEKYCHSLEKISFRVASTALSPLSCVGPDQGSNGAGCKALRQSIWNRVEKSNYARLVACLIGWSMAVLSAVSGSVLCMRARAAVSLNSVAACTRRCLAKQCCCVPRAAVSLNSVAACHAPLSR